MKATAPAFAAMCLVLASVSPSSSGQDRSLATATAAFTQQSQAQQLIDQQRGARQGRDEDTEIRTFGPIYRRFAPSIETVAQEFVAFMGGGESVESEVVEWRYDAPKKTFRVRINVSWKSPESGRPRFWSGEVPLSRDGKHWLLGLKDSTNDGASVAATSFTR